MLGIDLRADGEGISVPCDATTFEYPSRAVVLFCRPCHSDWVERAIDKAKRRADIILYVGLEKNLEDDLGKHEANFKKIGKRAGKEGEGVWYMKKLGADIVRWSLVQLSCWAAPSWMEDGGDRWINLAGGYCPKGSKDQVFETVLTDEWHDLDWTKTNLYRTSGDTGWLEPGGRMHYCDPEDHRLYADLVLKSSDTDLLDQGWCKVNAKDSDDDFYCQETLTAEQRNFLQQNGYRGFLLEETEDEPGTGMLSAGDGKEYPSEPSLLKRDRTSE